MDEKNNVPLGSTPPPLPPFPMFISNVPGAQPPFPIMAGYAPPANLAYLRPLRQPLFDAEWLTPDQACQNLRMFQRPLGQNSHYGGKFKSEHYTNLNQSSMLDYPIEFSIYGFNYAIAEDISLEDRAKILSGVFEFTFGGRRSYLQCPLIGMPSERRRKPVGEIISKVVKLQGEIAGKTIVVTPERIESDKQALRNELEDEQLYNFLIGEGKIEAALRIKPGEAFGVKYSWPEPIIVSKPVLLYAFVDGLMWTPF